MNRLPLNLPTLLRAEGVLVVAEQGWGIRGRDFSLGIIGAMQHHWGSPAATFDAIKPGHCWPASAARDPAGVGGGLRTDSRVNCNVFSDRGTGAIHLIAAGASNYSSCYGSPVVYSEVRADTFPGGSARSRGLVGPAHNTICGNRYFLNMEAEHAGDGSPMPAQQEENIARFWAVVLPILDLSIMQYIGHLEWTARKIDPRWSGGASRMPVLRNQVRAIQTGAPTPPPPLPPGDIVTELPTLHEDDGYTNPTKGGKTALRVFVQKLQALLAVSGFIAANTFDDDHVPDGRFGPGTKGAVKDFQVQAGLDDDGIVGPLTWRALLLDT